MTKEEFKKEWAKNDCKITFADIAQCAKEWNLYNRPKIHPIYEVRYKVLKAAGVPDAKDYKP